MNRKLIRCIVIDDEPPAIRLLEKYIEKVPFLELVTTTTSSLAALQIIEKENLDLVFLDIQMPDLTGIQLSKILNDKIKIIFTTAYPQFAIESYDLNAVDYLLKPFEFERFYQAVLKVNSYQKAIEETSGKGDVLFVKTDGKNNFEKIYTKDIIYVEGLKNYVAIHLTDKQIITYSTLKSILENLPKSHFVQIHKSYLVAVNQIDKTTSISVCMNGKELPLGNTYKIDFFKRIGKNML